MSTSLTVPISSPGRYCLDFWVFFDNSDQDVMCLMVRHSKEEGQYYKVWESDRHQLSKEWHNQMLAISVSDDDPVEVSSSLLLFTCTV